jgi:hypothetical protein
MQTFLLFMSGERQKPNLLCPVCHRLPVNTGKFTVYCQILTLVSQDCDIIQFLSICCAYEDNIASRYYNDESDQSDITGIDSTWKKNTRGSGEPVAHLT